MLTFLLLLECGKIVVVFTRYPQLKAHVRALAKLKAGNVQRTKRLHRAGFLQRAKEKNTTLYFVNPDFLLLPELQGMVEKVQNLHDKKEKELKAD
jgi:hypothetical protein